MFNEKEEDNVDVKNQSSKGKKIAKKDFVIHCNEDHIEIKKGDPVNVPEKYLQNLKTEGVI